MGIKRLWVSVLVLAMSVALVAVSGGVVFATTLVSEVDFNQIDVGTQTTVTKNIDKLQCPPNEELQKVDVLVSGVSFRTTLTFENTTQATDFAEVRTEHNFLSLDLQSTPTNYKTSGVPLPHYYPGPTDATFFKCTLSPGQNQSQCVEGALPVPMLLTAGPNVAASLTSANGAQFTNFIGPGTIPVVFEVGGRLITDVPSTWASANESPGLGHVKLTYTCGALVKSLSCDYKALAPSSLGGPDAIVKAEVKISNTGDVDIADLVITDVMTNGAKLSIVPGTSKINGLAIADPVLTPPATWKFGTVVPLALAKKTSLVLTFDVKVTGLDVGEELCDQITASSAAQGISDDGPGCRKCVTRTPTVPALTVAGVAISLALVPVARVLLNRRRRKQNYNA